jgi:hypothetical protein
VSPAPLNIHPVNAPGGFQKGRQGFLKPTPHFAEPAMNEKLPIPCEPCHGTGLIAGIECNECRGKGHRVLIGGQLMAQTHAAAKPQRWGNKRPNRPRPPSRRRQK